MSTGESTTTATVCNVVHKLTPSIPFVIFHLNLPSSFSASQVLSGEISPTKVICTPSLLSTITPKVGRFLGPKGLMPNPKRGTVREDMDVAVQEAKGLMDWREDRQGHVRAGESVRWVVTSGGGSGSDVWVGALFFHRTAGFSFHDESAIGRVSIESSTNTRPYTGTDSSPRARP